MFIWYCYFLIKIALLLPAGFASDFGFPAEQNSRRGSRGGENFPTGEKTKYEANLQAWCKHYL